MTLDKGTCHLRLRLTTGIAYWECLAALPHALTANQSLATVHAVKLSEEFCTEVMRVQGDARMRTRVSKNAQLAATLIFITSNHVFSGFICLQQQDSTLVRCLQGRPQCVSYNLTYSFLRGGSWGLEPLSTELDSRHYTP